MKAQDVRSQKGQNTLIGAITAMTKAADLALRKYSQDKELITLLTDAVAMALQYNHEVNHSQRMKKEIHKDYAALCNLSTIFLRPKKDGTYRTILNLKAFNEFIAYHHFKMDTLEAAVNMMRPGFFMALVDLKDVYYTVPIIPSHQKYLKFCLDGVFYKYTCLPNGLASAPRIFTKLLKPVYATLRSKGHLKSGYINDSYLQGDTSAECHKNVIDTIPLFTKLRFHIHPEKSVFIPSQKLTFLGFVLDSIAMTVMLTAGQVAEVIGILVTNFPSARTTSLPPP